MTDDRTGLGRRSLDAGLVRTICVDNRAVLPQDGGQYEKEGQWKIEFVDSPAGRSTASFAGLITRQTVLNVSKVASITAVGFAEVGLAESPGVERFFDGAHRRPFGDA
jgi:hypothetical protein